MNLILTGASGFVGQNVLKHFCLDSRIVCKELNFRLELPKKLQTADAILHLAGIAHDFRRTMNDDMYFEVNFKKTADLFDVFLKSDVKDFLFFSSVKAVSDTPNGVLSEEIVPSPSTPYGQSKQLAEQYLLSRILPDGKRLFILRPCMIHGPGNKGNLNMLYKLVERGLPYPLASFKNRRSFLSIANLQYILEAILFSEQIPSGIYNLADDGSLSTNELVEVMYIASGRKARLWNIPGRIIRRIAGAGDLINLPFNSERLTKLTENYEVSNAKIKAVLGIGVLPVSLKDGLLNTIQSFKHEGRY